MDRMASVRVCVCWILEGIWLSGFLAVSLYLTKLLFFFFFSLSHFEHTIEYTGDVKMCLYVCVVTQAYGQHTRQTGAGPLPVSSWLLC